MKASEARKATERAEESKYNALIEERRKKADIEKSRDAKYMRDEYPKFEREVYNDIRKATKDGRHSINVSDPRGCAWKKLGSKLIDDGYRVEANYVDGSYENMGDFEAPCNIWNDPYWYYKVSW